MPTTRTFFDVASAVTSAAISAAATYAPVAVLVQPGWPSSWYLPFAAQSTHFMRASQLMVQSVDSLANVVPQVTVVQMPTAMKKSSAMSTQ